MNAPIRPHRLELFHAPLASSLEAARELAGLTRSDAAELSGIDSGYIWELETGRAGGGRNGPGIFTCRALANAYGLTVSQLIGETLLPAKVKRALTESEGQILLHLIDHVDARQ